MASASGNVRRYLTVADGHPVMDPTHAGQTQRPAGVILRDSAGNYYAISGSALERFQVPTDGQAAVEAFLKGEEPITLPCAEGEQSASLLRTSRRSDELWLLLS